MRNYHRDGWSDNDWQQMTLARDEAQLAWEELDNNIGSGGGSFGPVDLRTIIENLECALSRLNTIKKNYV